MEHKRKWMLLALAALMIVAVAVPATAAITQFTDVPDTNIFANDIQWMADNDVTRGCNSGGTLFCPQDNVTREQMSAFMRRLATGGAVDAGTLDGLNSTAFLRKNAKAADSDLLDGLNSTAFLRKNAKAADSNLLDGLNSTDFARSNGDIKITTLDVYPYGTGLSVFINPGGATVSSGGGSAGIVTSAPNLPTEMLGIPFSIASVELCYDIPAGSDINIASLSTYEEGVEIDFTPDPALPFTGAGCSTNTLATPVALDPGRAVTMGIGVNVAGGDVTIHRITYTLIPTEAGHASIATPSETSSSWTD